MLFTQCEGFIFLLVALLKLLESDILHHTWIPVLMMILLVPINHEQCDLILQHKTCSRVKLLFTVFLML